MQRLAILALVAVLAIQVTLQVQVSDLQEQAKTRITAGRLMLNHRTADGKWYHVVQGPKETIRECIGRYTRLVESGIDGSPGVKSEEWTDAAGNLHQVVLPKDPTWTEKEWCRAFEEAVALLQKAHPCE